MNANRARRRLTYGGKTAPRYSIEGKPAPRKFVQHPLAYFMASMLLGCALAGRKVGHVPATAPRRKAGRMAGSYGRGIRAQFDRARSPTTYTERRNSGRTVI